MSNGLIPIAGAARDTLEVYDKAHGPALFYLVESSRSDIETVDIAMSGLQADLRRYGSHISFDAARAKGRQITLRQFVGRGCDFERRQLVSSWRENSTGSGSSWTPGPALGVDNDRYMTDAYAEAFSEAAHGISIRRPKLRDLCNEWFATINGELLGGLHDDLIITQWTTDWSNWFDAGHEYWGSFFWTVRPPDRPWTVAITASTTD